MKKNITYKELLEDIENTIGELSLDQCIAIRCIWEAYFNNEDPRLNNTCKIEE